MPRQARFLHPTKQVSGPAVSTHIATVMRSLLVTKAPVCKSSTTRSQKAVLEHASVDKMGVWRQTVKRRLDHQQRHTAYMQYNSRQVSTHNSHLGAGRTTCSTSVGHARVGPGLAIEAGEQLLS